MPLKIAMAAPLSTPVPPERYGGTERVVSVLTEELVRRGHDVTLFASGDSRTAARLVPVCEKALWKVADEGAERLLRVETLAMLSDIYRRAGDFDVIHAHTEEEFALAFARLTHTPTVLTLHDRLDLKPFLWSCERLQAAALVSVSMAQRLPVRHLDLPWFASVHNGIRVEKYPFFPEPGEYLAFVGRISPDKRPDLAVQVARETGLPLKVGAAVHSVDLEYWRDEINPLFRANDVEFLGEINDEEKAVLFGGALATLFPSDWPEPFGIVMPESMATGTPVIALDRGAAREVVEPGVSGFICQGVEEMIQAVGVVGQLDRALCRKQALRFSAERLADSYENVYHAAVVEARSSAAA
ncbi:glycosyltransferase family 4 protein [Micromonospora sp. NPDC050686]|uniref:glycosyltransferase family 4 protein n=1 Tax=Micromonospora sp. NPDC050686 TaxID=3154631 RepID=UPI0033CA4FBE